MIPKNKSWDFTNTSCHIQKEGRTWMGMKWKERRKVFEGWNLKCRKQKQLPSVLKSMTCCLSSARASLWYYYCSQDSVTHSAMFLILLYLRQAGRSCQSAKDFQPKKGPPSLVMAFWLTYLVQLLMGKVYRVICLSCHGHRGTQGYELPRSPGSQSTTNLAVFGNTISNPLSEVFLNRHVQTIELYATFVAGFWSCFDILQELQARGYCRGYVLKPLRGATDSQPLGKSSGLEIGWEAVWYILYGLV